MKPNLICCYPPNGLTMSNSASVEQFAEDWTTSERVVSAVAEATGADPVTLEPLYTVVDPDALDALLKTSRPGPNGSLPRVSFAYCGCDVVVSADGSVQVSRREQPE